MALGMPVVLGVGISKAGGKDGGEEAGRGETA